jgi:superfamily II DNA or RNA helicase
VAIAYFNPGKIITKHNPLSAENRIVRDVLPCGWKRTAEITHFPNTLVMGIRLVPAFQKDGLPLELSGPELPRFQEWRERYRLALRMRDAEELPTVPGEITESWAHQRRGFWFAYHTPAAILSAGVGTGKSKVILDLIRARKHRYTLVVTTVAAVDDWTDHVAAHGSDCIVCLTLGDRYSSSADKLNAIKFVRGAYDGPNNLVVSVSYESVWRDPLGQYFLDNPPDFVVADEIHKLGGVSSAVSKYMEKLGRRCAFRLGASGTVIRHKPEDGFGVFRFVDPAVFGTNSTDFKERYCVFNIPAPWERGANGNPLAPPGVPRYVTGYQNLDEYGKYFAALAYHVPSSVLNLPKPLHYYKRCRLSKEARRVYEEMQEDFIAWLGSGEKIEATNVLTRMLRLQQIANGYVGQCDIDPDTGETASRSVTEIDTAKRELFRSALSELDESEPCIVFAKFRPDLDNIRSVVTQTGRPYYEQSGRRHDWRAWRDEARPGAVLCGQVQSASEAINLTRARYVFLYSLAHSLYKYDQCLGRVDRPGQTRSPIFIHLITGDTIEEKIYAALRERRDVIQYITSAYGGGLFAGLSAR